MAELNTLGSVIKGAYESQADTNAFTNAEKTKLAGLQNNPFTGIYNDLQGKPDLDNLYQKKARGTIGPPIPALYARRTTALSTATGVNVAVLFNTVGYDPFDMYTAATGTIVMPSWARYARFSGRVTFAAAAGGTRGCGLLQGPDPDVANMTYVAGAAWDWGGGGGITAVSMSRQLTTGIMGITPGQTYRVAVSQSSGSSLNVLGTAAQEQSWLEIELFE